MWEPPARIVATNVSTLRPGRAPPTRPTSLTVALTSVLQPQPDHQRRRHDQPGVSHQARIVEGHLDAVKTARY